MDILRLLQAAEMLWNPLTFALLVGLSVYLVWMALAALRPVGQIQQERLDGYLGAQPDRRVVAPRGPILKTLLRNTIHSLGRFAPKKNWQKIETQLQQAGRPGNMGVLDFLGLRLFLLLVLGGGYYFFLGGALPFGEAVRNAVVAALLGYMLPVLWLRRMVRKRQRAIVRALPDALDMLTIGVEAGLAFESALLRVGEKWDNPLTREFRRTVSEMRVGAGRREALERMAARVGVDEVSAFVAVLVQSSQMGISIAQVLRTQADQMRLRRRQMAEGVARQASVKIVVVLVFLIFPSIFIVVLGPTIPRILQMLGSAGGGG
jgi:tight adherence protein C